MKIQVFSISSLIDDNGMPNRALNTRVLSTRDQVVIIDDRERLSISPSILSGLFENITQHRKNQEKELKDNVVVLGSYSEIDTLSLPRSELLEIVCYAKNSEELEVFSNKIALLQDDDYSINLSLIELDDQGKEEKWLTREQIIASLEQDSEDSEYRTQQHFLMQLLVDYPERQAFSSKMIQSFLDETVDTVEEIPVAESVSEENGSLVDSRDEDVMVNEFIYANNLREMLQEIGLNVVANDDTLLALDTLLANAASMTKLDTETKKELKDNLSRVVEQKISSDQIKTLHQRYKWMNYAMQLQNEKLRQLVVNQVSQGIPLESSSTALGIKTVSTADRIKEINETLGNEDLDYVTFCHLLKAVNIIVLKNDDELKENTRITLTTHQALEVFQVNRGQHRDLEGSFIALKKQEKKQKPKLTVETKRQLLERLNSGELSPPHSSDSFQSPSSHKTRRASHLLGGASSFEELGLKTLSPRTPHQNLKASSSGSGLFGEEYSPKSKNKDTRTVMDESDDDSDDEEFKLNDLVKLKDANANRRKIVHSEDDDEVRKGETPHA